MPVHRNAARKPLPLIEPPRIEVELEHIEGERDRALPSRLPGDQVDCPSPVAVTLMCGVHADVPNVSDLLPITSGPKPDLPDAIGTFHDPSKGVPGGFATGGHGILEYGLGFLLRLIWCQPRRLAELHSEVFDRLIQPELNVFSGHWDQGNHDGTVSAMAPPNFQADTNSP